MGDLQDGMLMHYLEQSKFSDANVEARIAREPFMLELKRRDMKPVKSAKDGEPAPKSSQLDDQRKIATKSGFNPGKGAKKGK